MLPEGADCAFSLELADGQPMLRGLGVVLNAWPTANNRFGRPGVHIGFTQLTTASQPILERVIAARSDATARRAKPITQTKFSADDLARWSDESSVIRDVAADSGVPTAIEEKTNQTTRYEGPLRAPAIPAKKVDEAKYDAKPRPARITGALAMPPIPSVRPKPPTVPPPPFRNRAPTQPPPVPKPAVDITTQPIVSSASVVIAVEPAVAVVERAVTATPTPAPEPEPVAPARARALTRHELVYARLSAWFEAFGAWLRETAVRTRDRAVPLYKQRVVPTLATLGKPQWRNARIAAIFAAGIFVGWLFTGSTQPTTVASVAPVRLAAMPVAVQVAPQCPPTAVASMEPKTRKPFVAAKSPTKLKPAPKPVATKPTVVAVAPKPVKQPVIAKPTVAAKPASKPSRKHAKCSSLDCI